ncbi:NnrU family protein [Thetidibacter halocola]|uniref:NnrU family protein n=1 Tax=Thetidibacter halocola TaxID=2827239 RepID=A0A8J7WIY0_9RHOB|nr:NnrU family protein [Thetidibacter halocola]MBS0126471.1 NnrU family protein [Thetidibacter halocola]
MGWLEFVAAYAVFFASHSLPVRPSVRPWLEARLGSSGFTLAYSALSLVVLAWLIGAAGRAPHLAVWDWAPWQVHVPLTVMGPVCLILALSIGRPNPFSFGGARNDQFDPALPGIIRLSRHPLLLALALWAAAHVVPNGDLAHVILFGTFAAFALLGGRLIDRRKRREMGPEWQRRRDRVADAPLLSASQSGGTLLRVAAGIALYGALLWAHPFLFGVSPLP